MSPRLVIMKKKKEKRVFSLREYKMWAFHEIKKKKKKERKEKKEKEKRKTAPRGFSGVKRKWRDCGCSAGLRQQGHTSD